MNRFRKKSETRRPQALDDPRLFDLSRPSSASTSNSGFPISDNTPFTISFATPSSSAAPPALPALSTGSEFRTSLIFPDLTRSFQQTGKPTHIPESKIRSKLAQQRLYGVKEERITEEEEDLMFAALGSIQVMRRARGNSSASLNNSTISPGSTSTNTSTGDTSVELLYPESVGSGTSSRSPGMSSAGLISSFPDTPAVGGNGESAGSASASGSIYPFASLSSQAPQTSSASPRRHSNNLFGSSRFRDASYMKSLQRNRAASGSTNATTASTTAIAISSDILEEASSPSPSPSPSPIEPNSNASTAYIPHQHRGLGHTSDKDKTPVARPTRLPLQQPSAVSIATASLPRLPNGTTLTEAQLRRISVALDRAFSEIAENEHEADDDEEHILAPHSVPLGGGYPSRATPPTAFSDPSNSIEVSDFNAVLVLLDNSRQSQAQSIHSLTHGRESSTSSPVPVSSTPTPGYVPGMNRPISPRDTSSSGHDSEDYSTTPRATSPVTPFNRGGVLAPRRQQGSNGRPSTAPTRIGMNTSAHIGTSTGDWRGQYQHQGAVGNSSNDAGAALERSYSNGQAYERRFQSHAGEFNSNGTNHHVISGYGHRRRPSSPLALDHLVMASATSGKDGTSTSLTGAAATLSRSMGSPTSAGTDSGSDTLVNLVRTGIQTNGNAQRVLDSSFPNSETDRSADVVNGQSLSDEKSLSRLVTETSLPDAPMVDDDPFRNYFPISAIHTWAHGLERQAGGGPATSTGAGSSAGGIVMPQPTQRMPAPASSVPIIPRSQTPNNLVRSTAPPVAPSTVSPIGAVQISPIPRIGTPNYLLQRSPSANGFHMDHHYEGATAAQDGAVRRTLSHTPSTSSTSAYNPMLHSSLGSSSRSSTGSIGSSYHSSDEGDSQFREVSNWLFDPESKGSTFVSGKRKRGGGNGGEGGDDSSRDETESKDDASDSIGDQEDVLQLLTGLTKRDLSNIQQKLVSAAVAREAEEAIRLSQRRRRPSVQSREFVGSATPKPQVTTQGEPVIVQRVTSPAPVIVNRVQSPAPEARPEPENIMQPEVLSEPPMIVARPLSPVEEPPVEYAIPEEPEPPLSVTTTPPQEEAKEDIATPPVDQSPRAKALAEALFGGEATVPAVSPPRINLSAEELHDEVERKVMAATTALKNPSLSMEGSSPLRRKPIKRIDFQKISGPQLVSASMSVDVIPLASTSMTSLGAIASPQDGVKLRSGIGSRLRRLGGSLRTKTNTSGHERDNSGSGNVVQEPTSSGLSQVVDYYPPGVQQPQIRSVPPHAGDSIKGAVGSPGVTTPPATAGPAGLKGFITRLRRPGGGSIKRGETSPGRPAISGQPSAFLSSTHLNENESAPPISRVQPSIHAIVQAPPSDASSAPSTSNQTPDEVSIQQLFAAASNLGLDPAALNELLSQRMATQDSKPAPGTTFMDTQLGNNTQKYEDSSNSSWAAPQPSAVPFRQPSTRVKIEAGPRLRPSREGGNPPSAVVRRTIIYPSTAPGATSTSPLPGQTRGSGVQRKGSTASNTTRQRRPISFQSQHSAKSVHDRTPTPPPPRGAAAKRMSQDGLPPMPGSILSLNGRPSTSAGVMNDGNADRRSIDLQEGSPDVSNLEDGRALQVVELENGEVIWSVLDSLRAPGDEMDDDLRSNYFSNRGSFASHYSGVEEPLQVTFKGLGRSTSRAGMALGNGSQKGLPDGNVPETKVFYSDAKEIARIIGQITNAADYGHFNVHPGTPSTRSSEDLPVEEQLERLMQRLAETR